MEGEAAEEECSPLSHIISRGEAHTAYHKGASARRNVYMMSNDSPNIDLPSLQLERVIKGSPDKKSQEEENLVCVTSLESFLNGATLHHDTKTGRSYHVIQVGIFP